MKKSIGPRKAAEEEGDQGILGKKCGRWAPELDEGRNRKDRTGNKWSVAWAPRAATS